ncbi:hypothetical protein [Microbacterium azadirachtae]|uniref:hypothetical protein n=1 Tax=Microbacterium azadirachtae TaxID=582680 RepID=UPI0008889863|nr:hypothetical protein [Microbacterium azadirachtae]SDL30220.1 hypothetical protein SAMN04488593_0626 [Microbacterium azadirachtae]SEF60318.1 hypothetical protein SAMN04488594_0616 [Microbacterium azadirachtae]SEF60941.1 hypothetical protein SAMN04488592_0625 [Microbacterium azadirachtae]
MSTSTPGFECPDCASVAEVLDVTLSHRDLVHAFGLDAATLRIYQVAVVHNDTCPTVRPS